MELPDEVMIPEVTIPEVRVPRSIALPVVVGVIALGVGVGVGYVLGKIRNKRPYFEGATDGDGTDRTDVESERSGKGDTRESSVEAEDAQPELPFDPTFDRTIVVEETETEITIMDLAPGERYNYRDADEWDRQTEAQNRTPNRPYVIHVDEYSSNESDYPHETLTYYEGDDVLCDKNGQPQPNRDIFGLLLFGHGSEDPNLVYIRNEKIECEYEIQRMPGHWGIEVLGLDEEIQHSRKPRKGKQHPKFRME